jgi:tetratricopeptide (TPR) repeat protein
MEKGSSNDKIKLIYRFNDSSPLFARVAEEELDNNNPENAAEILSEGIAKHPDYATAYFLYGKTLAKLGHIDKAEEMINKGSGLVDSEETVNYYRKEIEKIKAKEQLNFNSRRVSFFEEEFEEKIKKESDERNDQNNTELDELAQKLEGAKIDFDTDIENDSELEEFSNDDPEDEKIVSETLGEIYLSQGKHQEALKIFKKLMEKEPKKRETFQNKIDYIEKLIQQEELSGDNSEVENQENNDLKKEYQVKDDYAETNLTDEVPDSLEVNKNSETTDKARSKNHKETITTPKSEEDDFRDFDVGRDLKMRKWRTNILFGILAFIIFNLIMYYLSNM